MPLVSLRRKIDEFAAIHSFSLIEDRDDLDDYKAAAVCGLLNSRSAEQASLLFGLKAYSHDPLGLVDILLPSEFLNEKSGPDIILNLVRQLGAREEDIVWPKQLPPVWRYTSTTKSNAQEVTSRKPSDAVTTRLPAAERRTLVVGRGIFLQGTAADAERLVVDGTVESQMIQATELQISHFGVFKGEIQVEDADIAGVFDGTITARGSLVIRATGRVLGVARCRRLLVEEGGQFSGRMEMLTALSTGGALPMPVSDLTSAERRQMAPYY